MAQIPYSPVPNNVLQLEPTPKIGINTPEAAFGGDVGKALSTLGQTSDQVGNEIFQRALAMQQLDNESQARQASADYMIKAGELHANFSSLQGSAAGPDAFNKYTQDLTDARNQIRSGLNNPAAQKLFDGDSLSTMGRTIFNGAGHSAEQMKQYALGASKSLDEAANNQILSNPTDERSYQAGLAIAEQQARFRGEALGHSPAQIEQDVLEAKSDKTASRIMGLTRSHSEIAKQLFDKAISDGSLRGEAISKVQDAVDRNLYTISSKNLADGVANGTSPSLASGPVPIERAAAAIRTVESGSAAGNYDVIGPTTDKGDNALGAYGIMRSNLPAWLKQAGLPSMTPDQFIKDHTAQDTVFQKVYGPIMQKEGASQATNIWFTGKKIEDTNPNITDSTRTSKGITPPAYLARFKAAYAAAAPLSEQVDAVRADAQKLAPDKPLLQDYAESQRITQQHQQDAIKKEDQQNTDNTLNQAILDGKYTIGDIKASSPEAAQALEKLNPKQTLDLIRRAQAASKQDDNPSPARDAAYQRLNGMAYSDATRFSDINPYDYDLTATQRGDIIKKQKDILSNNGKPLDDPHLKIALSSPNVRAGLASASIKNDPNDHDDYDKYTGALQDELQQQMQQGKPVSYKDAEGIALRLLQDHVTQGAWWNSSEKIYAATPPSDVSDKIRTTLQGQGKTPSDQDIQRIYSRMLFNQSQKKDTKDTGRLNVEAVPGSSQ